MHDSGDKSDPVLHRSPKVNLSPEIFVEESRELWSEFILSDGTVLRAKPIVNVIHRVLDQFDDRGRPLYSVTAAVTFTVKSFPPELGPQKQ